MQEPTYHVRHGSTELDTFVSVLDKRCQAGLSLFEPYLRSEIFLYECAAKEEIYR